MPTKAQIEAAAAAMRGVDDCALPMSRWEVYAIAALTAAADVPEQEHIPQKPGQKPGLLPSGNTAAEVRDDLPPGVSPLPPEQERRFLDKLLVDHTIERCAQVVKNYTMKSSAETREQTIENLVAAIRTLRDN